MIEVWKMLKTSNPDLLKIQTPPDNKVYNPLKKAKLLIKTGEIMSNGAALQQTM